MSILSLYRKYFPSTINEQTYSHTFGYMRIGKAFGSNPPSRSCVAIPMPTGIAVAAEITFLKGSMFNMTNNPTNTLQRRVLHIQSQSSWAPLCIGPYSQAQTIYDVLIFVSGQIALDPNTMELIKCTQTLPAVTIFESQVDQCIMNISRILIPLHSNLVHLLMLTVYVDVHKVHLSDEEILKVIRKRLHVHVSNHRKYVIDLDGHVELSLPSPHTREEINQDDNEDDEEEDDYEKNIRISDELKHEARMNIIAAGVPISVIKVEGIPRSSMVEFEAVCIKASRTWKEETDVNDDNKTFEKTISSFGTKLAVEEKGHAAECEYGYAYGGLMFHNCTYIASELRNISQDMLTKRKTSEIILTREHDACSNVAAMNINTNNCDIYSWNIFLPSTSACVPEKIVTSSQPTAPIEISPFDEINIEGYLALKSEVFVAGCLLTSIKQGTGTALLPHVPYVQTEIIVDNNDKDQDEDGLVGGIGNWARTRGDSMLTVSKESLKTHLKLLVQALLISLKKADIHIRFLLSVRLFVPSNIEVVSFSDRFSPTNMSKLIMIQDIVHEISSELGMDSPLNVVVVPISSSLLSSQEPDDNDMDIDAATKGLQQQKPREIIDREEVIKLSFLAADLLQARSEAWVFRGE